MAGLGRETGFQTIGGADPFEQYGQEVEVHAAHEAAVLIRQTVERTVDQGDLAPIAGYGFVAVAGEELEHRAATVVALGERPGDGGGLIPNHPCARPGRRGQAIGDRSAGALGFGDGSGEQRAGEVVAPVGIDTESSLVPRR